MSAPLVPSTCHAIVNEAGFVSHIGLTSREAKQAAVSGYSLGTLTAAQKWERVSSKLGLRVVPVRLTSLATSAPSAPPREISSL